MRYELLIPEYILAAAGFLVVTLGAFWPGGRRYLGYIAALGALAALGASFLYLDETDNFMELVYVDDFTTFFRVLFTGVSFFVIVASIHFVRGRIGHVGEYYGIILFSTIGAIGMSAARELITAYISLELLSFSLYILTSFLKFDRRSNEAGLKYVLLGAFSSAIFLYGLSLVFGTAGTTRYEGIATALVDVTEELRPAMVLGLVLVVAGLAFKVSAMPFHMYTPDAYEGAPLPITAYISSASKAGGFGLLLRLFSDSFLPVLDDWQWMVALLAAITMMAANLIAMQQHNIKRLLAYSSMGQVGYMLIAIAVLSPEAASALLLHMAGYIVTNLAAFTCVIAFYNRTGKEEIRDFAGLAERSPFLALTLTICLFSLAGMPLFAGFVTKFILFQVAVEEDMLWLAAIAVIASFISLYYYLLIIKQMYLGEPASDEDRRPVAVTPVLYAAISVLVVGVFFLGLFPRPVFDAADRASRVLFG